jgi:PhzF family phenazine biosynthesis protein
MIEIPYAERHAFPDGDTPHTGNPAGVARLAKALPDADLLGIAQSNNLSETAFLLAKDQADLWDLRWFTPEYEVDLCGHATLAAAAVLFDAGQVKGGEAAFDTRSGRLTVTKLDDGRLAMDFPEVAYRPGQADERALAALGAKPVEAFEIDPIHGSRYQMLVFTNEAEIARLQPDFGEIKRSGVNLIATAKGDSADFVSRFFAPVAGVDEDPVTGSAHCTLGPFWADRLGQSRLTARQIGPRPGALDVEATGGGRVRLIGAAKPYLDGVIRI